MQLGGKGTEGQGCREGASDIPAKEYGREQKVVAGMGNSSMNIEDSASS